MCQINVVKWHRCTLNHCLLLPPCGHTAVVHPPVNLHLWIIFASSKKIEIFWARVWCQLVTLLSSQWSLSLQVNNISLISFKTFLKNKLCLSEAASLLTAHNSQALRPAARCSTPLRNNLHAPTGLMLSKFSQPCLEAVSFTCAGEVQRPILAIHSCEGLTLSRPAERRPMSIGSSLGPSQAVRSSRAAVTGCCCVSGPLGRL